MSVLPGFEEPELETKECEDCHGFFPLALFRKNGVGSTRAKCRDCERKYNKNLAAIRRLAPPKPDRCDMLGVVTEKLHVDHDHITNQIRGHICDSANIGLARLGDNLEGPLLCLFYMLKATYKAGNMEELVAARKRISEFWETLDRG